MKPESIRKIAWTVPTTNEELTGLGVLGENIIKEYGERLLRAINNFVEKESLVGLLSQKQSPATKKVKVQAKSNYMVESNDDEFGSDVDFSLIEIP